jgi:Flp pilus assembly protein TadD
VRVPGLVLAVLVLAAAAEAADPAGSPGSREALRLCHQADEPATTEAKRALLQRGLSLGEKAVASDEQDALAHFAVFCNVGRLTELDGLGPKAYMSLRRMRREIDRTLELAPDFADALKGKGALLLDTPRLLGGDPGEAERVLRRALALEPDAFGTRLYLARALEARGAKEEARTRASEALAIAESRGDAADVAEARKLIVRLGK